MKQFLIVILFLGSSISSIGQKKGFDRNKSFTILNSERGITTQSTAPDTLACKGWTIPRKVLPTVIRNSRSISGTEWDLRFDVLPCIVSGKLKQNGVIYEFEINAGSWLNIFGKNTKLLLGNFRKGDRKYFISSPE